MDVISTSISDRQGRPRDTCVSANTRCWRLLSGLCLGVYLNLLHPEMPLVRHSTEVKYL